MSLPAIRRVLWLFALCLLLPWPAARAQAGAPLTDGIRARVEQLATGPTATQAKALVAFYRQRQFRPAWTQPATVDQLLTALGSLREDGLDPEDYHLAQLQTRRAALGNATPAQQVEFELLATDGYLGALVQLYRGKVDPATLDPQWNFDPRQLDPAQGLQAANEAVDRGEVGALFARARPQDPLYGRLRDALAALRKQAAQGGWPQLPDGPTLKPGMHDARVSLLRQRLIATGDLAADAAHGDAYDATVRDAVRSYQREQYLDADGNVGPATRAAMNVPVQERIYQLRVNLERARWLLHQIQGEFVVVDIAGYKIAYYKDGKPVWASRVQVGKPYRSTPVFKSQITYLTFNPTWTVPPTIFKNDIVPKVRANLGYLAANRIRVLDSKGRELAPSSVNWANPRGIVLRQDAGPGNSLGRVVIRFPNDYAVYLHDTPHQAGFAREQRANSSGCIRVERPRELVELLLDDPAKWNRAAIDRAIDTNKTQSVTLRKAVPVLLAYWTVDVADDGRVGFRQDIYGRDGRTLAALEKPRASALDALAAPAPSTSVARP